MIWGNPAPDIAPLDSHEPLLRGNLTKKYSLYSQLIKSANDLDCKDNNYFSTYQIFCKKMKLILEVVMWCTPYYYIIYVIRTLPDNVQLSLLSHLQNSVYGFPPDNVAVPALSGRTTARRHNRLRLHMLSRHDGCGAGCRSPWRRGRGCGRCT